MNFDTIMIHLGVGLLMLIIANIALGSISAIIACEWDFEKFWRGAVKALVIAAALMAVYYAGYLNPDLIVIDMGGEEVNLMTAVYLLMLSAFGYYAVEVVGKLKDAIITPTPGKEQLQNEGSLPPNETEKDVGGDAFLHEEAYPSNEDSAASIDTPI